MKYDTVIVGAGPAGSVTARFAAEAGAKVLLIDRPVSYTHLTLPTN